MKIIKYNKKTKEIIIHEIGKFITKKNIISFIKIIPSFALTVMSLVITWVGVGYNERSAEIYEKQLEIMTNDREPYFTIKSETIDRIFRGSNYNYKKKIYTIKNEGGLITGACIPEIYTYVYVKICNNETGENGTYILYLNGIFEQKEGIYSFYDSENKEFKFYKQESDKLNSLIPRLKSEFGDNFGYNQYTTEMYLKNVINIKYVNYQNIEFDLTYQIIDDDQLSLVKINDNIDEAFIILNVGIEEDFSGFEKGMCQFFKNHFNFGSNEEALLLAKNYISNHTCSRKELIERLHIFDIYSYDNAVYAADNCGIDWNKQAIETAKNYLSHNTYSYNRLLKELTSIEKFTFDQAVYGIDNCEIDWNEQAKRRIQSYVYSNELCSYDDLIKLLEDEGFTYDQAVYGVEQNGFSK